jgi:hypothetical protein
MIVTVLRVGLTLILAYIGSRRRLTQGQLLFVTMFFAAGAAMVVRPDWATHAANKMNVGRGTDMLLYFAVMCGVLIAANFYFRFKQNDQVQIIIVRQLAILSPMRSPEDGS